MGKNAIQNCQVATIINCSPIEGIAIGKAQTVDRYDCIFGNLKGARDGIPTDRQLIATRADYRNAFADHNLTGQGKGAADGKTDVVAGLGIDYSLTQ